MRIRFLSILFLVFAALAAQPVAAQVTVTLPTISGEPGDDVLIPVTVSDLTGQNVRGFEFTITFDPNIVTILRSRTPNTISQGMFIADNANVPGEFRVAAAAGSALSDGGTLVILEATLVAGGTTPLTWSAFKFNDGIPAASTTNGSVEVVSEKAIFGITPESNDFGSVAVGQSTTQDFTLSNTGDAAMTGEITLTGDHAADYAITAGGGTYTLDPSASQTITVSFTPSAAGARTAALSITHNAPDTATPVTVALTGVGNGGPSATDDTAETQEDTAITIDVLSNDTDAEGDALSVTEVSDPDNGSTSINADGTIAYTPDENFGGEDTFTYTVSDGNNTATATVTVTVTSTNDPPEGTDDTAETQEDTATTIAVLDNDFDPEADALSVTEVSNPADGTATINADGTITYTPDENFNGEDSFTYTLSDGTVTSTATVTVTVIAVNDPPSAATIVSPGDGDSVSITGEPTAPFIVTWSTSTDPEGDDITYTWQLSTAADFTDTSILLSQEVGSLNLFQTTFGIVGPLLTANGVALDASITLFHRVVASDGTESTVGPTAQATLTRGSLVNTDDDTLPAEFALNQNYPNPFNPVTTIGYALPKAEYVRVAVYDVLGQQVAILVDATKPAGNHEVTFNAQDLPSGTYLYRIEAGSFRSARQLVLLK